MAPSEQNELLAAFVHQNSEKLERKVNKKSIQQQETKKNARKTIVHSIHPHSSNEASRIKFAQKYFLQQLEKKKPNAEF